MVRLSDNRIAFRFESGEFGGPFVAELEPAGSLTLWPLTHAAWSIGSVAPLDLVTAYYEVATSAFSLPGPDVTPCRTTNDPIASHILKSFEVAHLVLAGVLVRDDEPEELLHNIERQERLRQ